MDFLQIFEKRSIVLTFYTNVYWPEYRNSFCRELAQTSYVNVFEHVNRNYDRNRIIDGLYEQVLLLSWLLLHICLDRCLGCIPFLSVGILNRQTYLRVLWTSSPAKFKFYLGFRNLQTNAITDLYSIKIAGMDIVFA